MKQRILRRIIQVLGVILPNAYFTAWDGDPQIYQGKLKGFIAPILNCYACPSACVSCPAGSAQHFIALRSFPFFVVGLVGGLAMFLGRSFCGWLCPFGFLQDMMYKLGRKLKLPHIRIPKWMDYGRYLFLILFVIILPFMSSSVEVFEDPDTGEVFEFVEPGQTWFCKICPQGALEGGIPQVLIHPELQDVIGRNFTMKMIILGVFLLLFLITKRPFCRVVCPVGAFLGLFNKVSLLHFEVDDHTCKSCDLCYTVCPVEHRIYESPNHPDCIRCGDCVSACPWSAIHVTTIFKGSGKKQEIKLNEQSQ